MGRNHRAGLALKQMQRESVLSENCKACGQRLGKHRHGDDACPNTDWRPGNGKPQWRSTSFRDHWVSR